MIPYGDKQVRAAANLALATAAQSASVQCLGALGLAFMFTATDAGALSGTATDHDIEVSEDNATFTLLSTVFPSYGTVDKTQITAKALNDGIPHFLLWTSPGPAGFPFMFARAKTKSGAAQVSGLRIVARVWNMPVPGGFESTL